MISVCPPPRAAAGAPFTLSIRSVLCLLCVFAACVCSVFCFWGRGGTLFAFWFMCRSFCVLWGNCNLCQIKGSREGVGPRKHDYKPLKRASPDPSLATP